MSKERIKTIIIFILLGVVILFIGIFCGMYFSRKEPIETPNNDTVEETKEEEKELTTEEILASLSGEWGMCYGEYDCRGIFISKSDNGEYIFTPYVMWSDGSDRGIVKKVEKVNDNKYMLNVYFAGYNNELGSAPERTHDYTIDISEVSINNLYVGDTKYQFINGDREAFFQSIMY